MLICEAKELTNESNAEAETLISRLIDRPIRPLFPEGFRNEVQVLPTVLSYEKDNDPEILSLIAASAALAISGIPFWDQLQLLKLATLITVLF